MVVGSLVGVKLLTSLLTPDAYGELALGMTIATFVNQILFGPLGGGITRFYAPAVEQGDINGYIYAVKKLVLFATAIIVLLVVFSITGLIVAGQTQWIMITVSALVFAILSGYCANLIGILTAARQRSIVAMHQGIDPMLRSLIAAGLLLWLGITSTVAMVGYAIAALFILGSQLFFFQKYVLTQTITLRAPEDWQAKILNYSWPLAFWGLFSWARLVSDRWALMLFSTTQDVGLYAVLYQLGFYPISLITGVAVQFLAPVFYQWAGDASDGRRTAKVNSVSWRLTGLTLAFTGVAFTATFLFHVQIFHIFVAKEYSPVSHLLPWLLLAGGVFAASQTMALNLMSQMKTHVMMVATITTSLLGVMLNFSGACWFGIEGIIFANVFFSILYSVWLAILSRRIVQTVVTHTSA